MLDVAVVGVPDERAGQLPRVFIVAHQSLTEEAVTKISQDHSLSFQAFQEDILLKSNLSLQVRQHMRERLSEHKQPLGGVSFLNSIPKSASGKILRRELLQQILNQT